MQIWHILSRVATVAGIVGGLLFLLLVVLSLVAFMPGGARVGGGRSIDHEPISLETAVQLIDSGHVYMVALRKEGNMDEYFLLDEAGNESRKWSVDGIDVHVFTESLPTGVPILSDNGDDIGITPDQLNELLRRVDQFNAASSWQIQIIDHREQ